MNSKALNLTACIKWAALTLLALIAVYPAIRPAQDSGNADSLSTIQTASEFEIEIVGREFDWHFRILAPSEAVTRSPHHICLPKNAHVKLKILSDDYVYSLRIPEWGVHQVAVPGLEYNVDFTTTQTLDRVLLADPMCGFSSLHDPEMGRITVTEGTASPSSRNPERRASPAGNDLS